MVVEEAITPNPELEALLRAIDRFRQRPRAHREPQELAAELKGIRHGQDLLELEFAETAANFSKTEEYEEQGSVSPIDWIRHHCRMSSSSATTCRSSHGASRRSRAVRLDTRTWR